MSTKPQAIGIAWHLEADHDAIRQLFASEKLLRTQDQAAKIRKRYVREGHIVVKAHIDPRTFAGWCPVYGIGVNAKSRVRLANAEAHRVLMETNKSAGK